MVDQPGYKNLLTDFRFLLIIDDIAVVGFSEVSGLGKTIDTEDYKEGKNDFVHKLPATGITYSDLTLKRSLSDTDQLWKWYLNVTLALIAFREYEDSRNWRDVAKVNDIDDPRTIVAGIKLTLPPRKKDA